MRTLAILAIVGSVAACSGVPENDTDLLAAEIREYVIEPCAREMIERQNYSWATDDARADAAAELVARVVASAREDGSAKASDILGNYDLVDRTEIYHVLLAGCVRGATRQ